MLILASDGVWEFITSQATCAVSLVRVVSAPSAVSVGSSHPAGNSLHRPLPVLVILTTLPTTTSLHLLLDYSFTHLS